jgi:hypothetical protein
MQTKPMPRTGGVLQLVARNGPWLVVVLAATAFGQWLVLHNGVIPIISSDGVGIYLAGAHALPAIQGGFVDPRVPPLYPLLLAGVFDIAGHDNLDAVLVLQSVVFVATIIETYALLTMIGLPRLVSTLVAAALGAAPWLVQWERYVLTETFSCWLIITLFLAFVRLLRRPTIGSALICGVLGAAIPLTRPALGLVPGALVLVLLLRAGVFRRAGYALAGIAGTALVFAVVSYVPVGLYIAANAAINGCYCFTSNGNIDFFGKIYEYGMQEFPADAKYATIAAQVASSDGTYDFLAKYPEYAQQNFAPLSAYARSQFLRYPRTVAFRTVADLRYLLVVNQDHAVLLEHPYACNNDPALPYPLVTGDALQAADVPLCAKTTVSVGKLGEDVNRVIYGFVFLGYVMLPLSLALAVALGLVQPLRDRAWILLATAAVLWSVLLTTAVFVPGIAFDRFKLPVDGLALIAGTLLVGELWFVATRLRRALRNPTEPTLARSA